MDHARCPPNQRNRYRANIVASDPTNVSLTYNIQSDSKAFMLPKTVSGNFEHLPTCSLHRRGSAPNFTFSICRICSQVPSFPPHVLAPPPSGFPSIARYVLLRQAHIIHVAFSR
ncbi:cytoplasmic dynein 1 heavy chain 1-like [Moniliophthora roreri]|nr:cytoplasmic dynein 1 heavy chain 1-like [Moniliophthora roreri]